MREKLHVQSGGFGVKRIVVAFLMCAVTLLCIGAEGPADEMESAWIAQDGQIPTNMTHAAWRAEKLACRAERLKPVVAMSKTWVYCRHYVLGQRSTFLHLSELSDAFEQRSYRAIGSSPGSQDALVGRAVHKCAVMSFTEHPEKEKRR